MDMIETPLRPIDPALILSVRDHVHNAVRTAILGGTYAHGSRLNERQLAAELGVSTTPLKEAMRQLEVEGLVQTLPRKGVVVLYGQTLAEEMILARAALESMMARMAAQRITTETAAEVNFHIDVMTHRSSVADPDGLIAANGAFHEAIHKTSQCFYLRQLIERQRFYDATARRLIHTNPEEKVRALAEHAGIGKAIIAGDEDGAEKAMRDHVVRSGQLYLWLVFDKP